MVKISVIIPVYNSEKTVANSVNSVLAQTFADFEIILINDGSTDNSLSVCESIANSDKRISLYSFDNHGAAFCRNFGIGVATGDYLTFVDSDDRIDSGAFSYMIEVAEKNTADIVMCGYILENGDRSKIVSAKDGFYIGDEINSRMIEIKSKNLIDCACNKLYRREFIENSGVKLPENEIFEDTDFNLRLLEHSPRFVICDVAFYHYILHMGSTTRRFNPQKLATVKQRAKLLKRTTRGIDKYCDFYFVKSVFSAFIDAFLSLKKNEIYKIIKSEINNSEFRNAAKNASHSGLSSKIITVVANTKNTFLVFVFCRLSYIFKYKFQKLFMKVK